MKKTYIAPTMKVVTMRMRQKLCVASLETNVNMKYKGATQEGFDEDDMR